MIFKFTLIILTILIGASSSNLLAQDKLIKIDNTILDCKILQVNSTSVEINPSGDKPFLLIPRNEVKMIIYSDDTVVDFLPQGKDKERVSLNTKINSTLEGSAKINVYRQSRLKMEIYEIQETIEFADTLNNKEYDILINGSFQLETNPKTDKWDNSEVIFRNLHITVSLREEGSRASYPLEFNRVYKLEDSSYSLLDGYKGIELGDSYCDLLVYGGSSTIYYKSTSNDPVGFLKFDVKVSNH